MPPSAPTRAADTLWTPRRRYHFLCARGKNIVAVSASARRAKQQVQTRPLSPGGSGSERDAARQDACPDPPPAPRPTLLPHPADAPRPTPTEHQARGDFFTAQSGLAQQQQGVPATGAAQSAEPARPAEGQVTQTIFKLERRGEGWGEEILPHLVVEERVVTKSKRRYSTPDPWQKGSLEEYLVECGAPPADVDRMVTQAVAWRYTPGGRPLIDRRRRLRVERNVRMVVEHLEMHCGVPFGPKGIAAIFAQVPEIMLCKPSTNDRWDRRAVELSAYLHRHGHANVPEDWEDNPELGQWVKRQRVARAAGQLSEERLAILGSMGFEFGEVAQLTEVWEHRFDQLIDWILWHNENSQVFSWVGYDWGARGGLTARELALWITLQREYRRRGLLPVEALRRFEALHVLWDPLDATLAERTWMGWLGRLLYVIERNNTLTRGHLIKKVRGGRPPKLVVAQHGHGALSGSGGSEGESDSEEEEDILRLPRRGSAAVAAARQRLQQEVAARRAALRVADLRCEPGLRFWLAKQRYLWRRRELPQEQVLMLQLAGADMDTYTPAEWQDLAHTTAAFLQGSEIVLGPLGGGGSGGGGSPSSPSSSGGSGRGVLTGAPARPASSVVSATLLRAQQLSAAAQRDQVQGAAVGGHLTTSVRELRGSPGWPGVPAASLRLRVRRWVETQQALLADNRLSPAQLRYMTFLGITWVLSEEVMSMSEASWQALLRQLAEARMAGSAPPPEGVLDWLRHQHGLVALGCLAPRRLRLLEAVGAAQPTPRGAADRLWDLHLSELLAFKREHGNCLAPLASSDAHQALGVWLTEQQRLLSAGLLPQGKAAQLKAIGVGHSAHSAK